MNIETDRYEIASLKEKPQAIEMIKETESKIAEMTGRSITLIAYSEAGQEE